MSKKICMLIFENYYNTQPGHREATTLQQAGYDVTVLCNTGVHKKQFEILDDVKILRVNIERWRKYWSKIKFLVYFIKATIIGVKLKADFYHCHDLLTIIPGFLSARITGGKVVYHSNELNLDTIGLLGRKKERFVWKLVESFLIKRVDSVITLNESIADELVKRYHLKEYPTIIRNCPRQPNQTMENKNLLREKFKLPGTEKIAIYQGGLINGRGLARLIESVKYFPDNASLVVLGDGYLKNELIELAKNLNLLDKKIFFHDYVPADKLLDYTASADIGVITYQKTCLNYYYVLPNKIFEYFMAGLPIIASNFPELSKLVNQFENGELVNPENPKQIGEAVAKIISDKKGYQKMQAGSRRAAKIYNWENEGKKLLALYHKL